MSVGTEEGELERFLDTADYQAAVNSLRKTLRSHLLDILGGDWEQIHNEYGMYTINTRVKGTKRTLEKYAKLKTAGRPGLSPNTFHHHMPDLAGGRLVVVDPGDLFGLAERVRAGCVSPKFESPGNAFDVCRVRHGRFSMYDTQKFHAANYKIDHEATGYCSVHFVFRTGDGFFASQCDAQDLQPLRKLERTRGIPLTDWRVEIQVRTMMDEAWGEIDHFVRYEDPALREDLEIRDQFAALSAYLQAANHHVAVIRNTARRKAGRKS